MSYDYRPEFRPPPARSRSWHVTLPLAVFVVVALAWSGFWYYASAAAQTTIDGWRQREAKLGRVYTCASQTLSGYPFHIEVACTRPSVELRAIQPAFRIRLNDIQVVSQVYDPTLLISEFRGPLTAGPLDADASWSANWSLAQTSVRGLPSAPERMSIVFDNPIVQRRGGATNAMLDVTKADRFELHGRVADSAANGAPRVELVLRLINASAPTLHPLLADPLTGEIGAVLSGPKDLSPRPWPVLLREVQAAGGKIEIKQARLQQASSIVVGTGTLGLTPRGELDGQLQLTIVGLVRLLKGLDIDKAAAQLMSQADLDKIAPGLDVNKLSQGLDRIMPGLGGALRNNSGAIAAAGVAALGQQTTLEGRPAVIVPLRFADGAAFLGPLRIGDLAPLF